MKLLKHVNNTDVAAEVLKTFFVREKKVWKLRVRWWNIGDRHPPYCMRIEQTIEVSDSDLDKWKPWSFVQ